jgi:hypothetical protein
MSSMNFCKVLGVVLILVGLAGYGAPSLLGMHLTPTHNLIHIVSGAVALGIGLGGTPRNARTFCAVFGAVYLGLGVLGFIAPDVVARVLGHPGPMTARALSADNIVHLVIGGACLLFAGRRVTRPTAARA